MTAGDSKLSPELEAAVFSAKTLKDAGEGSLSDVVKVGDRYSVLYVTDLKPAVTQPLSAVRGQIEAQVLAAKKNEAGQAFVSKEVAALKPTDNLDKVLAAQAKRVADAEPKPTAPASDSSTPDSAAPAGATPADGAPADAAPKDSATPPATDAEPATPAPATR